jgi:hypothetical protein
MILNEKTRLLISNSPFRILGVFANTCKKII